MDSPGQETLGRYRLLALLATGGMAEIHLARQTGIQGFERLAVVKRILPHLAKEKRFLEMFFDEAKIAAQLNHPNIVQIYELGQQGDQYYIAMEYLEGESLAYLVHEARRTRQSLPPELAAGIVAQVCDGLDYAHSLLDESGNPLRIVHRDISPQNIIVLFSGAVKLVDFGIAKAATQAHQTRVGTLKGKLAYMSPEQCRSQDLDARSDVFSLGAVLWELLARRRLFKRPDEAAIIHAIAYEPIPSIRAFHPEVPESLEAIALRALCKKPSDRFQTAGAMGEALHAFLREMGAAAGPREIGAFAGSVFAERARTKRKILEEIRKSDGRPISLGVLKPDTFESLPGSDESQSGRFPRASTGERVAAIADAIAEEVDEEADRPASEREVKYDSEAVATRRLKPFSPRTAEKTDPHKTRKHLPIMAGLVMVLGAGLWWLLAMSSTTQPPESPVMNTASADAGADAGGPDAGVAAASPPIRQPEESNPASDDAGVVIAISPDADTANPQAEPPPDPAPPRNRIVTGLLKLDTDPWSDVYLGRRKLGTTPITGVRLPAGVHRLTLKNPELGISRTISVAIEGGRATTVFREIAK
jgi:serine/threonine-protein kinase